MPEGRPYFVCRHRRLANLIEPAMIPRSLGADPVPRENDEVNGCRCDRTIRWVMNYATDVIGFQLDCSAGYLSVQ